MGLETCEAIRRHVPADVSRDERRFEGAGLWARPFYIPDPFVFCLSSVSIRAIRVIRDRFSLIFFDKLV